MTESTKKIKSFSEMTIRELTNAFVKNRNKIAEIERKIKAKQKELDKLKELHAKHSKISAEIAEQINKNSENF